MPKTILYVAWAPFFSGAERALFLTLQALDRTRYEPFVVVGTSGELKAQLQAAGIRHAYVKTRRTDWRRPVGWAVSTLRVALIARSVGAALVHSNETPSFHQAGYAAKMLGIPTVAHVRFPDGDFRWFLKPGFSRAVFVSQYLLGEALSQYPQLFDGRAEVIHDGVLLPDLPSPEERIAARQSLGLPATGVTVVQAGQVAEVKGIWDYLDAAHMLLTSGVEATFVVLGDDMRGRGELRRRAEEKTRSLGIENHVRFLGFRPNAAQLIPLFDIVAVPSHVEPLGNATLEAMAAARPVVGSAVGGIPEMIVEGETGFLAPSRDPGALAATLKRLIVDPTLRERLGAAGRRRAASAFGVARHAERVQALYDQLISDRGRT